MYMRPLRIAYVEFILKHGNMLCGVLCSVVCPPQKGFSPCAAQTSARKLRTNYTFNPALVRNVNRYFYWTFNFLADQDLTENENNSPNINRF